MIILAGYIGCRVYAATVQVRQARGSGGEGPK